MGKSRFPSEFLFGSEVIGADHTPSITDAKGQVDFRTGKGFMSEGLFNRHDIHTCLIKMKAESMTAAVKDKSFA